MFSLSLHFLDSISVNVGECLLTRYDSSYGLLSRVLYQIEYSRQAKKTFLRTFEHYDSDR